MSREHEHHAIQGAESTAAPETFGATGASVGLVAAVFAVALAVAAPAAHAADAGDPVEPSVERPVWHLGGPMKVAPWMPPLFDRLRIDRQRWGIAWGVSAALTATALPVAALVDVIPTRGGEAHLPAGLFVLVPAVAYALALGAAGAGSALGTARLGVRAIRTSWTPEEARRTLLRNGRALLVPGFISLGVVAVCAALSPVLGVGLLVAAAVAALPAAGFLHAGAAWTIQASRVPADPGSPALGSASPGLLIRF